MIVKRLNKTNVIRVLRTIWIKKRISRIEIAKKLALDKSTITNIVSGLKDLNLVHPIAEGGVGPSGGRRPIYLTINKNFGSVIGFEIRPDLYKVVVLNLHGEVILFKKEKINISSSNFVPVFKEIAQRVIENVKELGVPPLGIGLGISGIVNTETGIIITSIPLNIYEETEFISQISQEINIPVIIENDVNCCCWGEIIYNNHKNLSNFIFVLIYSFDQKYINAKDNNRISVSMGIVINNKIYHGSNYLAGVFRSIFWEPPNKSQFSLSENELLQIHDDIEIFNRYLKELAFHIALFVNTFDFNYVILNGFIINEKNRVINILQDTIKKNSFYPNKTDCIVRFSNFGDKAVAYGSAGMFLEKLFTPPGISTIMKNKVQDENLLFKFIKNNR